MYKLKCLITTLYILLLKILSLYLLFTIFVKKIKPSLFRIIYEIFTYSKQVFKIHFTYLHELSCTLLIRISTVARIKLNLTFNRSAVIPHLLKVGI